jgi:ribonuclease P protein component
MLAAQNRLRRRRDFQQLFRGGRVVRGKYLILRAIPNPSTALVGFVVSSTIFKHATDRNTLKRQLRSIVRERGVLPNMHCLLAATTAARHQSYQTLTHEVDFLFQQLQRQKPRR